MTKYTQVKIRLNDQSEIFLRDTGRFSEDEDWGYIEGNQGELQVPKDAIMFMFWSGEHVVH